MARAARRRSRKLYLAEGQTLHAPEVTSGDPEIDDALAQGRTWLAESRNLALLSLYESRIQRRFEKNMAELRTLQAARKAALEQTIQEAALLTQLAETESGTFDQAEYFAQRNFAFSAAEIAKIVSRYLRLASAIGLRHIERAKRAAA